MKLVIGLATRGRPELLKRTIDITLSNVREASTRLFVLVDEDDKATLDAKLPLTGPAMYLIRPRPDNLGDKYNTILKEDGDVFLAMVDYAPHITPGFDTEILKAASLFPDGIGAVFNRYANLSFPEINAVTRGLAERMGYFYPPHFPYWFVDHWLDDIARMINRISYADVRIDTSQRPGTMDRREPEFWATFFDLTYPIRMRLADSILATLDEPHWRKELCRHSYWPITQHSEMINSNVRGYAARWNQDVPPESRDERYERLRAKAVKLLLSLQPELEANTERIGA